MITWRQLDVTRKRCRKQHDPRHEGTQKYSKGYLLLSKVLILHWGLYYFVHIKRAIHTIDSGQNLDQHACTRPQYAPHQSLLRYTSNPGPASHVVFKNIDQISGPPTLILLARCFEAHLEYIHHFPCLSIRMRGTEGLSAKPGTGTFQLTHDRGSMGDSQIPIRGPREIFGLFSVSQCRIRSFEMLCCW